MNGRRTVVGFALLGTLLFCAYAAPSAFASKGTTAFTCVKAEKGEFEDAHCTKSAAGGSYKHQEIKPGEKTNVIVTNKNTKNNTTETTPAVLKFWIGPMDGEFNCTTLNGEGTLTNNAGPPMNVSGTITTTISGCTVLPQATFPGCQLEGAITTKASVSTPTEGMKVEFKEDGEAFTKFKLTKCKSEAENLEIQITGSYWANPSGTTWETTQETSELQSTGHAAALIAKTTVTMSASETGIALTTTET